MTHHLAPRGPDAWGFHSQGPIALGHRRLKIMDLSDGSAQPMIDSQLGLSLAFNGAIYNFPELRAELESLGYAFYSDGDTEVLLKGYHAWGADLLPRLNGMFALAIWERDSQQLFLARDRLGSSRCTCRAPANACASHRACRPCSRAATSTRCSTRWHSTTT